MREWITPPVVVGSMLMAAGLAVIGPPVWGVAVVSFVAFGSALLAYRLARG